MNRWVVFVLALAVALAVCVWVGWTRYGTLEPAPVAVLTPAAPVEVGGTRFTLVGVSTPASGADAVPGTTVVRLDLLEEGGPGLACSAWLVAGADRWQHSYTPESRCQDLWPGEHRRLSFTWEVPAGVRPAEFELRFGSDVRLSVRP